MEKQLARLAVAQVILVVYAVLAAGMFLKCAHSLDRGLFLPNAAQYSQRVRDYGVWMLLVPAVWTGVVLWYQRRPRSDASTFTGLYVSGILLIVLLFCYAIRTSAVFVQLFNLYS